MKIEYSMKFALLALCVTFATANAYALECTVDDPTGTPLMFAADRMDPSWARFTMGQRCLSRI